MKCPECDHKFIHNQIAQFNSKDQSFYHEECSRTRKNREQGYPYKCPACAGKGKVTEEYNKYPPGLPDSGWVYEPGYKDVPCKLCESRGYNKKEYKPRMVQDGWI